MLESSDAMGSSDYTIQRIIRRLDEVDRTKEWLAARLGVDAALVNRWLKGTQSIPDARLREIALVLHRPVAFFSESAQEAASA